MQIRNESQDDRGIRNRVIDNKADPNFAVRDAKFGEIAIPVFWPLIWVKSKSPVCRMLYEKTLSYLVEYYTLTPSPLKRYRH